MWFDVFRELPPLDSDSRRPPTPVRLLRWFGPVAFVFMLWVSAFNDPRPALHGRGLGVTLCVAALVIALPGAIPRQNLPPFRRTGALILMAVASVALTGLQPDGAGVVGIYIVTVVAALRLRLVGALVIISVALAAEVAAIALAGGSDAGDQIFRLLSSIVPWLIVMRLVRNLRLGRDRAERLVEELRESQAAEAEAATLAERGRVARDMHDVLAHALSALALQLESARLLARDRDADPEVVGAVERAHRLASDGLEEARRAIGALRGDELPGPEGLHALVDTFCENAPADCSFEVTGAPHALDSEARLALYRTAQEALTNVRKHAAADHVQVTLSYEPDGTGLVISDHGAGMAVTVGGSNDSGGGYGITGMRERAELLGGRLTAGPTGDGFRVALWLPA